MTEDTRLIAETSKLEEVLWKVCKCVPHRDGWHMLRLAEPTCPICHATGKVPFIDASNILWVEAWFYRRVFAESGHTLLLMQNNAVENMEDPEKRVAESERIMATAIREEEKENG